MKKILLIEDNLSSIAFEINSLRASGFKIVDCIDGDEALDEFEKIDEYDLIILDIMLPRGESERLQLNGATESGVALYREIRKLRPKKPVLILSAKLQEDFWSEIESDEHTGYLGKPTASEYWIRKQINQLLLT